jgi:hypothetical protein
MNENSNIVGIECDNPPQGVSIVREFAASDLALGLSGLTRKAITAALGTSSRSNSSRLGDRACCWKRSRQ